MTSKENFEKRVLYPTPRIAGQKVHQGTDSGGFVKEEEEEQAEEEG